MTTTPDTLPNLMPTETRKPGDRAVGVTDLAYGQPGPYQDSRTVTQVQFLMWWYTFEDGTIVGQGWKADDKRDYPRDEPADEHNPIQAQQIRDALVLANASGLKPQSEVAWHESYLDYVTVIGPGLIEIRTVSPYID